ncbi:dicarboxylate/amino acid:cation symporter [Sphingomonas tabacisoli]|uniref:Dicarboxylate/amino acid:cation symporter n=1 Tax=Sphingomonas tabacisoli TaxID=2249466 RepID=A0ABW4I4C2_9SPHN
MVRASFGLQIGAAMLLGLAAGLIARALPDSSGLVTALDLIGSSFVQLLTVLVPPLVFASIVASIGNLRQLANASRLVTQTLLWFAITALIAVGIGIALALVIQPGVGAGVDAATAAAPRTVGTWLDFLKGLLPVNVLGLSASTKLVDGAPVTGLSLNVLQIVVMAVLAGVAALKVGEAGEPFLAFARSLLAVVRKLLAWLIRLSPIGAFGLFGHAVATYGWDSLARLGWFAGAVYLGLAIVMLVVYPALLMLHGLSPARFLRAALPAIQLGFVTRSSIGTLPATEAAVERLGVDSAYASFAVPVAATSKMDGCAAIYPAIAAIFIAQFYGLPLGVTDYVALVLVSVIGSAATAGLTGALVMLTLALSTLGLPLDGAGLLLAIDPILDMGRTATNVAGQALVTYIVAHREGLVAHAEPTGSFVPAE